VDFTDYRDVAGVKMPFRLTFAWLDGRDAIQLSDVKINADIDAAKFGRPVNSKKK
jgi:outer membrane lipoprotein-sorting protein